RTKTVGHRCQQGCAGRGDGFGRDVDRGDLAAAHGRLPIPAPATAALLIGGEITPVDVTAETVTPTGAALLTTMADGFGPLPAGTMASLARGAGGRDPDHYPNVLTAIVVEDGSAASPDADRTETAVEQQAATILTTNVDDLTPELVANTIDRCLAEGAADAWATPIVMKKGRPAVELNVMCTPGDDARLRDLLFRETGTLGIRSRSATKHILSRRFDKVTVHGRTIAIKVGPFGAKPEYDDLVSAAQALGMPVRTLWLEALAAYESADLGTPNPLSDSQTET
ncbi:MAG: LarC family nickel insertion protein, partial [Actinomycetota bacterium]